MFLSVRIGMGWRQALQARARNNECRCIRSRGRDRSKTPMEDRVGDHNLWSTAQATIVGRHGGFADRVRAQWTWVRPIPEALDMAKAGPLLCGGVTVFAPFLIYKVPSTARVGIIGVGGLGHMAIRFANKWGCEVHAFTTSDSKEAEARKLGAHYVHNTQQDGALKKIAG